MADANETTIRDWTAETLRDLRNELAALAEMSDGVVGLTLSGDLMPWPMVIENYLPSATGKADNPDTTDALQRVERYLDA